MVASVRVARPSCAVGRKESDAGERVAKSAGRVDAERKLRVAARAEAEVRQAEDTVERPARDRRALASISNPLGSTKSQRKSERERRISTECSSAADPADMRPGEQAQSGWRERLTDDEAVMDQSLSSKSMPV